MSRNASGDQVAPGWGMKVKRPRQAGPFGETPLRPAMAVARIPLAAQHLPPVVGLLDPHSMQDHRKTTGDGDGSLVFSS